MDERIYELQICNNGTWRTLNQSRLSPTILERRFRALEAQGENVRLVRLNRTVLWSTTKGEPKNG